MTVPITPAVRVARRARTPRRARAADRFFAQVGTAALVLDAQGVVRDVNPAFEALVGRPRAAVVGHSFAALLLREEAALARTLAHTLAHDGGTVTGEFRARAADGTTRWVEVTASRRADGHADDADATYCVLVRDVDHEARRLAAAATDLAHDSATGAASLETLRTRAVRVFLPGGRSGEAALVVLEVERLAALAATHGPEAADAILATLVARLQSATRGSDVVARVAPDRLAVLLTGMAEADHVRVVVERLRRAGRQPIGVGDAAVTLGLRFVVVSALEAVDADDLLARGFSAIQASRWDATAARRTGVGRFAIEHGLRRLLADPERARRELWLAYQPVVDLATGRVTAVEALCRWDDPVHGAISPGQFVPIAEAAGLDGALGAWVLRRACAELAALRAAVPAAHDVLLHVNLSAGQIGDPRLPRTVADAATAAGVPLQALVLEVTETALALHPDHAAGPLRALRATGVRLALDDFGTGYSSLSALSRLPLDVLKIDRRFVADLREPGRSAELARMVLGLGGTLGLQTVAEGIEDEADAARVARLLPDALGQGWHYGRPVPAERLAVTLGAPFGAALARPDEAPADAAHDPAHDARSAA